MRQSVIGIYDGTEFKTARPLIYFNGRWNPCTVRVFDGAVWKQTGDTLWLYWRDSAGKDMTGSDNKTILVRKDPV